MDFSAANINLWSGMLQIAILCTALVAANVLRRKIPLIRKSLMPTAVLAGFIILILRPLKLLYINTQFLEMITYHSLGLGFIALGLRVPEAQSSEDKRNLTGIKSGALITADMTLDENRTLYAVPGDINRKTAQGGNNLIRTGAARLISTGAEVIEDLQGQLRGFLKEEGVEFDSEAEAKPKFVLSEEEEKVCGLLSDCPLAIDEIADRLNGQNIGRGRLATLLLSLEMKKIIRQLPGKVFQLQESVGVK